MNKNYQKCLKRYKNWLEDFNHYKKYPPRTFIKSRTFISLQQIFFKEAYSGQNYY